MGIRRLSTKIIVTAVLFSLIFVCGFAISGNAATATTETKKTSVVFRTKTEPDTLDPHRTAGNGDPQLPQYQIYESLFRCESSGKIVPALCESYTFTDDKMSLSVKLREGVKFHDGSSMSADDVVYSINRSLTTGFNGTYVGNIASVEKIDDKNVKINLKNPYTPIITCLATLNTAILSKAYVEKNGEDFLARNPMGTGAYVFKNWVSGERIDMEAFTDYWRGKASIPQGAFVFIADNSTALIAVENGEVDLNDNMNTAEIATLDGNPKLSHYRGPSAAILIYSFNTQGKIMSDIRMREAISLVVDRQAISAICYNDEWTPVEAAMLPVLPEFPRDFKAPALNIERAKALVKECYPNGITIAMPTIDAPQYSEPSVVLQEACREIGITLEVDIMERAAWNEKVIAKTDYELTVWALVSNALDADLYASKFYSANAKGGGNFTNTVNSEIDQWIERGRITESGPERNKVYLNYVQAVQDYYACVPFSGNNRDIAANPDLKGVQTSPTTNYYFWDYSY
ncbi:MAG: ABC transporter substrate-binding protein [Synergistaceae bacterium]|jgi:peptide/nickel transport system substrate-binding protein|nr:ABC transporter substrate-binding protein [Synergistaceae bacterium]